MISENTRLAVEAALQAGIEVLKIYHSGDFEVETKKDDSPLTKADKASHEIICSQLEKTNIPILSEEGKSIPFETRKNWNELWVLDPIDGTKEFIKRNGEFTVNIALIENQKPTIGIVFAPILGDLYYSEKGVGSFKVSVDLENYKLEDLFSQAQTLPLPQEDRPYTLVASRSHLSEQTKEYIEKMKDEHGQVELISKGSSLKLCMMAEGIADCYPRFAPTMEWDTAAGQAVCENAGCQLIDWETQKPMRYNRENLTNGWFIVS